MWCERLRFQTGKLVNFYATVQNYHLLLQACKQLGNMIIMSQQACTHTTHVQLTRSGLVHTNTHAHTWTRVRTHTRMHVHTCTQTVTVKL